MNKVTREIRICACGCGEEFLAKPNSSKKYVCHQHYLSDTNRTKRVERETRTCACGCGEQFEVKVTSTKRYVSGHNSFGRKQSEKWRQAISNANSGENNPAKRPEVRQKISEALKGRKDSEEVKKNKSLGRINSKKFHDAMKTRKPPRLGTSTSNEARKRISIANRLKNPPSKETKEKTRNTLLKHFSIMENRVKRAKQIAARIASKGYQYKTGYVSLPRLGLNLLYRSSYEQIGLLLLDTKYDVKQIFVETVYIPYVDSRGDSRIYMPDWLVVLEDGEQLMIEVKPNYKRNWEDTLLKEQAGIEWCKKNNASYCMWTENILFNNSSTTMSLQVIVEATATYLHGKRYSLSPVEIQGGEQK